MKKCFNIIFNYLSTLLLILLILPKNNYYNHNNNNEDNNNQFDYCNVLVVDASPQYVLKPWSQYDQQPPVGSYNYNPWLPIANIQWTPRKCYFDSDCPTHGACYRERCK